MKTSVASKMPSRVSAAASGAVCQWQTSSTDRRGSGDRPLGNVPPGRSGPQGGSQVSPPPLGEVSCLWHDGEGNLPTPRACASLLMSTSDSERLACRLGRFWTVPTGDQDP